MIHFNRLRLSGFKSFVDPTELLIEPGLTGIVGPNGCGKSNLVEALRWVMGENSARQMRGDEMDDIIFGGTANRPTRNLAEVSLTIDNGDRNAPSQFNDSDELEVTRRIERGHGSVYRVNGRESRARDVQVLFADAASGARSAAIVSQGKIGAIISAKPTDRRVILEDAAGIAGLHSRRQEAELRLKAAEENLLRLLDVSTELENRLGDLKKQAKQAGRYRALSEKIRATESGIHAIKWLIAKEQTDRSMQLANEISDHVANLTNLVAQAVSREEEASQILPSLRAKEAESSGKINLLTMQREQLDTEEKHLEETQKAISQRVEQITNDLQRETAHVLDATEAIARLVEEQGELIRLDKEQSGREQEAKFILAEVVRENSLAEEKLTRAMAEAAAADAERTSAIKNLGEYELRQEKLQKRVVEIEGQRQRHIAEMVESSEMDSAGTAVAEAARHLDNCRQSAELSENTRQIAEKERDAAREYFMSLSSHHTRLVAEADALRDLLARVSDTDHPPVLDQISVVAGLEMAIGAALGEDLSASINAESLLHWETLPPFDEPPSLPDGVIPLAHHVAAPPALARRLAQIGLVTDINHGPLLQSKLKPGQELVSLEGHVWRWDGFQIRPGAENKTAVSLRQRNRLRELSSLVEESSLAVHDAKERAEAANLHFEQETIREKQSRDISRQVEQEVNRRREFFNHLEQKKQIVESRLASLLEQEEQAKHDLAEACNVAEMARVALEKFSDGDSGQEKITILQNELAEKRAILVEVRTRAEQLQMAQTHRQHRFQEHNKELSSWNHRFQEARQYKEELDERKAQAEAELENLSVFPAQLEILRQALASDMMVAERDKNEAASQLSKAEIALTTATSGLREIEKRLASSREEKIRQEASVEQAIGILNNVAERIREKFELSPEELLSQCDVLDACMLSELAARAETLAHERTELGAINLLAEKEVEDIQVRISSLQAEREDMASAISQLRSSIAEINHDGKERLLQALDAVNDHFHQLFTRFFGGGRAHIALTEPSDPLQSGLEIMASPPGKRLQALSLLSGGEQALTALALLFAVFMTNPAPICILDEVDAPLDDANVDRFCTLVREISESSRTRFLVVTHHRMTMARMDRLFGVTMAEQGISTLVSVDLASSDDEPVIFEHVDSVVFA